MPVTVRRIPRADQTSRQEFHGRFRYLNTYSLMMTQGVYKGQRVEGNNRVCTLTRTVFTGQQWYSLMSKINYG